MESIAEIKGDESLISDVGLSNAEGTVGDRLVLVNGVIVLGDVGGLGDVLDEVLELDVG